jgi:hypothetical protein
VSSVAVAKRKDLIDQPITLCLRELARIPTRDRVGAAVHAREGACARGFTDDQKRRTVEVHADSMGRCDRRAYDRRHIRVVFVSD